MEKKYLVYCDGRASETSSIREALEKAQTCNSQVTIYRAALVAVLEPSEVRELLAQKEARERAEKHKETLSRRRIAIVFDQMFKGFAEVLEREITEDFIEFHEVLGRGINRTVKLGPRLFQQPARDDYDVVKLLEDLARSKTRVIFFTGDKQLATQARMIDNVDVEYLPPSEVAGKEAAIKIMLERIRKTVKELGISRQ